MQDDAARSRTPQERAGKCGTDLTQPMIDPMPRRGVELPPPVGYVRSEDHDALAAERDALRLRVEAAEGVCRSLAQSYDHDLGVYALGELQRAREMAAWLTSPAQKGQADD